MVLPVVCSNRQAEGRGVFDCVRACGRACVAEAVRQTTDGVTVLVLFMKPLWAAYIYMVEGFALGQSSVQIVPHKHREYKETGKLTMAQDNRYVEWVERYRMTRCATNGKQRPLRMLRH